MEDPFSKTTEELTTENMEENQYSVASSMIGIKPLLPTDKAYDAIGDIVQRALEAEEGADIETFFNRNNMFNQPKFDDFTDQKKVLMNMNVRDIDSSFRTQQDLEDQVNFLFNPQTGNTPEERAKSEAINNILAEIDNFAIQYNLSQRQKEQLKSQVLSNHLGEYITDLRNIRKNDVERERTQMVDNATKEDGLPKNEDALNARDDNNQRPDAEVVETLPASGAGAAEEDEREPDTDIFELTPSDPTRQGLPKNPNPKRPKTKLKFVKSETLDPLSTTELKDVRKEANDLARLLQMREYRKEKNIFQNTPLSTLRRYINTYETISGSAPQRDVMTFLITGTGLGGRLNSEEKNYLVKVVIEMKKLL